MSNLLKSRAEIDQRIEKKRECLANWLKAEVYTDYTTAAAVLQCTPATAYKALKAMQRDELIQSHEVGRVTMWSLTMHGQIEYLQDGDDPTALYDSRVSEITVRHTLAVQRARLAAEAAGGKEWQSERGIRRLAAQTTGKNQAWLKVPDGVVTLDGRRIAVEVERSPKSPKRYRVIMAEYLQMRRADTVAGVHYVCESPKLAKGLERIFKATESVLIRGTEVPLKPEHYACFEFFDAANWPVKPAKKTGVNDANFEEKSFEKEF